MLPTSDRANFDTISRAFSDGNAALVEVKRISDGTVVSAICAIGWEDGDYTITPFAILVDGNPFDLLLPPDPDGGFIIPTPS